MQILIVILLAALIAAVGYLIFKKPRDIEPDRTMMLALINSEVQAAAGNVLLKVQAAGSTELEEKRKAIAQELGDKKDAIGKALDFAVSGIEKSIATNDEVIRDALQGNEKAVGTAFTTNRDFVLKAAGEINTAVQNVEKRLVQVVTATDMHKDVAETLQHTVGALKETLKSTRARGAWGERMAEDVLRLAGMQEHVNYEKQAVGASGSRPDFQIKMPHGLVVNMDVKFPFDNWMKYMEAEDHAFFDQFIKDVQAKLRQITGKDYIDPATGTVDYAIMFMPNEGAYAAVMEHSPEIMDEALRGKVVLASPMTLFAVLCTIRQAMDSFKMETGLQSTLAALAEFKKQWEKYIEATQGIDEDIEKLSNHWRILSTTRAKALDRAAEKVVG